MTESGDTVDQKTHAEPFSLNQHVLLLVLSRHTPLKQVQKNDVLGFCYIFIWIPASVKIKLSSHHSYKAV